MKWQEAWETLIELEKRTAQLGSIGSLIGWDEQVNLPKGSAELRAQQQAALGEATHRAASDPKIGECLDVLGEVASYLSAEQKVVVREARKDFDRATRIPSDFVRRREEAQSRSYHAWVTARKSGDFEEFLPHLKSQLTFAHLEAEYLEAEDPYDYWIDRFDPGMTADRIQSLFTPLLKELKPLVETITGADVELPQDTFRGFPVDSQETFLREVVKSMGFNFDRGRIDTAVHPFCSGHPLDCRMTTRFDPDNPLDSLSSAMHETGHGLYEQGLPEDWLDTPMAQAVGMAVHESQARLWENQIGRSRPFWKHWEPRYRELFSKQLSAVDSDTLYRTVNRVALTPIRVDADEVTYNLHIMLRFELEKQLFSGEIKAGELPEAWNAASKKFLGFEPANHSEGCLQDVHWATGAFGYFPSYCTGNMIAAQLWYQLRSELPKLDEQLASGDCKPILEWLRQKVHNKGRLHSTPELVQKISGEELSPRFLVRYLQERYLPLYRA
ncbi:MAG: carboxypeptidase M32 [Opitutales bacterium]|nr:carboxypeptidase M32 [Opitutales bacterium]